MATERRSRQRGTEHLYQRAGTWWLDIRYKGRRIRESLETTALKEAKARRDQRSLGDARRPYHKH